MKFKMLAIAVLAAVGCTQAQQIRRFAGKQTLDAEVWIPPSEFSERRVLDLCEAFLAANSGYTVIRYFVVTDLAQAEKLIGPPGDIDFPGWLYLYKKESAQTPPTAELIKVLDKAVVRLRLGNGEIAERVIRAGDPLLIDFEGKAAKILEVKPLPSGKRGELEYSGGAVFFVQTFEPWTLALAKAFNKHIQSQTGLTNLEIHIEDGWWFVGDTGYPVYNRFLPYRQPPTFEEFKRHTRFYCGDLSRSCIQTGPAKQ